MLIHHLAGVYRDASADVEPEVENNYISAPEEIEAEVPQIEQAALFTSF